MRSTTVGLALVTAICTGCATGGVPRSPAPAGAAGNPGPAAASTGASLAREARAREALELGRAAMARGETAAAVRAFREALRLQPDLVEARESLGLALYEMGDLDGTVEELRALLRQHPDAVRARLVLATALMAKQDWSSARPELEEVLRRQPDLGQALYSLGLVRYALGDLSGAIEAYRQVLARSPDDPDARYNLALVLKLTHRDAEATPEFLAAARAGHARAQFFAGTAYARGLGVETDMARAIAWWSRAADQGAVEAITALSEMRQTALGKTRRAPAERRAVEQAFRDYRTALWREFPELTRNDDDTVGAALLRQGRSAEAVPVLISEALAFSEPAQALLEELYYNGSPGQVPAYDGRILGYFKTAADEGRVRARIALAKLYAAGLGVPKDTARAISLLKSTPHEDAQRLLQEISAATEAVPPQPVRP
jgi:TPR repeat protein